MTQVDGTASLAVRRDYLKRRREGRFGAGRPALLVALTALAAWLALVGFTALVH